MEMSSGPTELEGDSHLVMLERDAAGRFTR